MAGFLDAGNKNTLFDKIKNSIKGLSNFGMRYGDMVIRNSQAIGATESLFMKNGPISDEGLLYSLGMQDTISREYIGYFSKEYKDKKDYLRKFSLNPEIEFILDLVCDDSVVMDPSNFFAKLEINHLTDIKEDKIQKINSIFKKIYKIWGFNNDNSAWHYFRQLLIDGILAFEIIYDDQGKNIIGFKELDPVSILPSVEKQLDGSYIPVWVQFPDDERRRRSLYDSQIIYISYAKGNAISRVSYVERLIRPYNILRIMEYTRVIWSVMNSSFKMKMTVPIGTRSRQKGIQTLGELMSIYKEDIKFNDESGELTVDGRPKLQFNKNYLIPSGVNGTPRIEPLKMDGPNLNDMASLSYFYQKLIQESKIPSSRFTGPEGGSMGNYSDSADGMDKEEIRFSKFINRLRSNFQEILIKPVWLQVCKEMKGLEKDLHFKSELGLRYFSDNPFQINQEIETIDSKLEYISDLLELGTEEDKYFSASFLVEKYLGLTRDDIKLNKEAKEKRKKAKEEEKDKKE